MRFPAKKEPCCIWAAIYLLIELFFIGMPVVRTGVRTVTCLLKILES